MMPPTLPNTRTSALAASLILTCFLLLGTAPTAGAASLYWWPTAAGAEGGAGTWNSSASNWSTTTTPTARSGASAVPGASDDAFFNNSGGVVSMGLSPTINSLTFGVSGYTLELPASRAITTGVLNMASGITATLTSAVSSGTQFFTLGTTNTSVESYFRGFTNDGGLGGTLSLIKTGDGILNMTDVAFSHSGVTQVRGGTLVLNTANLPSTNLAIGNSNDTGGLIEFVGNGTSGTFNRDLGASATTFNFGGSNNSILVGFGARAGDITITTGSSVRWDSGASSNNGTRSPIIQLGTATSTGTVIYTTNLDIRQTGNTLRSGDGSAAVDADYTGALSTTGTSTDWVLVRDGAGTLRLSGNSSSFNMRMNLESGTTLVDGTLGSDTTNITYGINVQAGAVLGGDGTVNFSASSVQVAGTLMGGRGLANQSLTINSNVNMLADSILAFGLGATGSDQLIRTGGTWTFQSDQEVRLFDAGAVLTTYTLITGLAGTVDVSGWQLVDSGPLHGTFSSDANNVYFTLDVIPEPSSALLLLLGLGVLARRKRKLQR